MSDLLDFVKINIHVKWAIPKDLIQLQNMIKKDASVLLSLIHQKLIGLATKIKVNFMKIYKMTGSSEFCSIFPFSTIKT